MDGVRRRQASGKGLLDAADDSEAKVRRSLARFDIFPKVEAQVELQTNSGGLVTLVCLLVLSVLVLSELSGLFATDYKDKIAVDLLLRDRLKINLDMTFHALSCTQVEIISMDATGEHQIQSDSKFNKIPLQPTFEGAKTQKECMDCFGAGDPGQCCNTCPELLEAYTEMGWDPSDLFKTAAQCEEARKQNKSPVDIVEESKRHKTQHGCRIQGTLSVNKVAGNFHVALGHGQTVRGMLVHQFTPSQIAFFNTSHSIHSLWFGDSEMPGTRIGENALDGKIQLIDPHRAQTGAFQYFLEVVPTEYKGTRYYEYTKTEQFTPIGKGEDEDTSGNHGAVPANGNIPIISSLPGVFFVYDMSPFVVLRTNLRTGISQFIINLLAIIGGTFGLSKFFDRFFFSLLCRSS